MASMMLFICWSKYSRVTNWLELSFVWMTSSANVYFFNVAAPPPSVVLMKKAFSLPRKSGGLTEFGGSWYICAPSMPVTLISPLTD